AYMVRRSYPDILVTSEGIEAACHDLAHALCKQLSRNHQGVRRLRFSLYRADGSVANAIAGTSQPCRTPEHLITLFRNKLEQLDVGFGVDMIALEALQIECLREIQTQFATHDAPNAIDRAITTAALVDRLQNRLGSLKVSRLETAPSHIPERGQVRITEFAREPLDCVMLPRHRPAFLLPSPELITVIAEVPEGPPSRFTWRRVAHRIIKSEGPERISPEWWRHLSQTNFTTNGTQVPDAERIRDYYRLEDESGTQYWVFRSGLYQRAAKDGPPCWYMHGLFG
ncbi:MAG: hypothetical protein ACR2PG_22770, partial [Hyphomicrobiaceae bacterium]